jgi:hypothetical protein
LDAADELGRRLGKLRVAVTLVGSSAVARVAEEFPAHFQQFTIRRLELDGDDSERRRVRATACVRTLSPRTTRSSSPTSCGSRARCEKTGTQCSPSERRSPDY